MMEKKDVFNMKKMNNFLEDYEFKMRINKKFRELEYEFEEMTKKDKEWVIETHMKCIGIRGYTTKEIGMIKLRLHYYLRDKSKLKEIKRDLESKLHKIEENNRGQFKLMIMNCEKYFMKIKRLKEQINEIIEMKEMMSGLNSLDIHNKYNMNMEMKDDDNEEKEDIDMIID